MSELGKNVEKLAESFEREILEEVGNSEQLEFLRENYRAVTRSILAFESGFDGWQNGIESEKGFNLDEVKRLAVYAEKQAKTNALIGRGLRLKNNHVFGRGYDFEFPEERRTATGKIPPRFQAIIDDPDNQEVLFSPTAMKKNNRILFTAGNLFVIYNKQTRKFSRVSIDRGIDNFISYDDDPERIKYYLRSYEVQDDLNPTTSAKTRVLEWIPTSSYAATPGVRLPASIGEYPVNRNLVIIDLKVNNDAGEAWGVPDCLSALPWAWAASEFAKDSTKLLKALATLAYQVKAKTQAAQSSAGAKLATNRVAGVAITGPDTEINQIPRANAVDMYTGRPLQANVAAALDVSVTALTADTGKGGSSAAESTLSLPETLAAISRQEDFNQFFRKVFAVIGLPGAQINYKKISVDPIHRQAQSAALLFTTGAINQEEYRSIALELMDIVGNPMQLPEANEFTGAKKYEDVNSSVNSSDNSNDGSNDNVSSDPNARQGNSGNVGSITDDNELRSSDNTDTVVN